MVDVCLMSKRQAFLGVYKFNKRTKLGRKVRQTLPTLLFADPAGGKVKK